MEFRLLVLFLRLALAAICAICIALMASWFFGLRLGSDHSPHKSALPVSVGVALLCAWLGQLILDDLLFSDVRALVVKDAPEVYGALLGAVTGSLLTPMAVGTWRVVHRQEP